jgi:hypothetical protein
MNKYHRDNCGLLLVYDKFEAVVRQRIPMLDKICFDNKDAIGRSITGKTTPLTLQRVRDSFSDLKKLTSSCDRARAYIFVGISEHKSPMSQIYFENYLSYFHRELKFCGFDVCFVELIFNCTENKQQSKQHTVWNKRYRASFNKDFQYEKLKIVLDYKNDINSLPKQSYINLWETISEDYKEWNGYV